MDDSSDSAYNLFLSATENAISMFRVIDDYVMNHLTIIVTFLLSACFGKLLQIHIYTNGICPQRLKNILKQPTLSTVFAYLPPLPTTPLAPFVALPMLTERERNTIIAALPVADRIAFNAPVLDLVCPIWVTTFLFGAAETVNENQVRFTSDEQ